MKKKILFILFISGCFLTGSNAQSIAVKSNLLYDATSTLNMGVELGLSRQWTLDVPPTIILGNRVMAGVCVIGEYNRKPVIGFVSVSIARLWVCMVIMPISM